MTRIRIRRGTTASTPELLEGELRWNYETKELTIGDRAGNTVIAGDAYGSGGSPPSPDPGGENSFTTLWKYGIEA